MPTAEKKHKIEELKIIDCGLAGYGDILQKQTALRDKRQAGEISDMVLIVEHKPVITIGARETANKLLISKEQLTEKGIDLIEVRRGGGTTAHNPGQLVIYPILSLKELGIGINEYIRKLEQVGIELLDRLGVKAKGMKGYPGIWAGQKKIASIGVRVSRGITYHGMAININNDLSIFDYIIPCGLEDVEMTSVLKETGEKNSMGKVKNFIVNILKKHFV